MTYSCLKIELIRNCRISYGVIAQNAICCDTYQDEGILWYIMYSRKFVFTLV